jgi:hypothetical protein
MGRWGGPSAAGGVTGSAIASQLGRRFAPQVIELDASSVHKADNRKALLQLLREGAPEEFEPVAVACTAVEASDAVQIAELRNERKARLGSSTFGGVSAGGGSMPPLGRGFLTMQSTLTTDEAFVPHVPARAAGVKHIGYGPLKSENQDEFFIQVSGAGVAGVGRPDQAEQRRRRRRQRPRPRRPAGPCAASPSRGALPSPTPPAADRRLWRPGGQQPVLRL